MSTENATQTGTPVTPTPEAAPKVKKAPLITSNLVIQKNGVALTFVPSEVSRGRNVGDQSIVPSNENTLSNTSQWLGVDVMNGVLLDYIKSEAAHLISACTTQIKEKKTVTGPNGIETEVEVVTGETFDLDKFTRVLPILVSSSKTNKELEQENKDILIKVTSFNLSSGPDREKNILAVTTLLGQMSENNVIIDARKEM